MRYPGIEDKVAFLRRPASYAAPTQRVETKETHMSWVFLTDQHAWKLKKPVRYDYLDFSTVKARQRHCAAEVRLNRRLARDVYLDSVPLAVNAQGALQLAGTGEAVDWLVWMRRLPAARMLDQAIARHTVYAEDVRKLGALLAGFYQQAAPAVLTGAAYRHRLAAELNECRLELAKAQYELPPDTLAAICHAQERFLEFDAALLVERVRTGRIIEGHGDLRPEHICLERAPVIIDCLEFNREFRILDAVSELAYLTLECTQLGAPEIGQQVLATYQQITGDRPPSQLLDFYRRAHALLRAKIAVWHLHDHYEANERAKWLGKAERYLQLGAAVCAWER